MFNMAQLMTRIATDEGIPTLFIGGDKRTIMRNLSELLADCIERNFDLSQNQHVIEKLLISVMNYPNNQPPEIVQLLDNPTIRRAISMYLINCMASEDPQYEAEALRYHEYMMEMETAHLPQLSYPLRNPLRRAIAGYRSKLEGDSSAYITQQEVESLRAAVEQTYQIEQAEYEKKWDDQSS